MNDLEEEAPLETSWRQFYENPIGAATMHHINGNQDQASLSLIYENYKGDPNSIVAASVGGAVEIKLTNGNVDGAESIFLQGGAEVVKREPEDLTRKCISPVERIDKRCRSVLVQQDSPPALISTHNLKDELDLKEEERTHTIIIQGSLDHPDDKMTTTGYLQSSYSSAPSSQTGGGGGTYDQYMSPSPQPSYVSSSPVIRGSPGYTEPYPYRDFIQVSGEPPYSTVRMEYTSSATSDPSSYERYPRPAPSYKPILTVDSSPDSGISSDNLTPKEPALSFQQQQQQNNYTYEDISQPTTIGSDLRQVGIVSTSPGGPRGSPIATTPTSRVWPDYARQSPNGDKIQIPKIQSDDDKIHIEKLDNPYGFKYYFETPISTSPRREDDRITYINKGQFYAITMEYIPDPERHIKPGTVRSVVMLLFREEKSPEDESKAWYFWHARQHSVKQRILDVDTKNSAGLASVIEEHTHNAIVVYWNPLESNAKINIAVQCLSTDFSSQKGVKGLPLHVQIDTYEDARDNSFPVFHRGYCQIKVFCDKGAERKTRDEERRAQKRRLNPTTRKKYEDLYHPHCDRSEFYTMADAMKEPVLFKPNEDEKMAYLNMDMQGSGGTYYTQDPENGVCGVSMRTNMEGTSPVILSPSPAPPSANAVVSPVDYSPMLPTNSIRSPISPSSASIYSSQGTSSSLTTLVAVQPAVSPKNNNSPRFIYSVPQSNGNVPSITFRDNHKTATNLMQNGQLHEEMFIHQSKRTRLTPPMSERLMIYVKRDNESVYTPLHLVPPGRQGLINAIAQSYSIPTEIIKGLYRINKVGIRAKIDDDMLRHYCNEDYFLLEINRIDQDPSPHPSIDIILRKLPYGDD